MTFPSSWFLVLVLSLVGCGLGAEEDSNSIENQLGIAASGGSLNLVQELATTSELRQLALELSVGFAEVQSDYESKCSIEVVAWLVDVGASVEVGPNPSRSSLAEASRNSNCTQDVVDTLLTVTNKEDCGTIRDAMVQGGFEPRFMCR